jgi:trehalose 6-phosphate phosphatase
LCAFDFDGTLAPLADHPRRAGLSSRTKDLLERLAALYPCIVVSGRSRADLVAKLEGIPLARAIGCHGAEPAASRRLARVKQWRAALESELGPLSGVWVEEKSRALAIHYRQAARKPYVLRRIMEAARVLPDARVFDGNRVVNVTLAGDPHKGEALAAERLRLRCDWVLYAGDDTNDEDAFALDGNLVSVRIGGKSASRARYYLRDQREVDQLLGRLVALRE